MTDNDIVERSEMAVWKAKGLMSTETGRSMKESGVMGSERGMGSKQTQRATAIKESGRTTLKMEKAV